MKKKSKLERVDVDFARDLKKIALLRAVKGLSKNKPDELSLREMTSLCRKTEGYHIMKEELERKPKRRRK
tara:strand:+ start:701 stop:910 length:210 start_codon:yes stop_codon:yes gene_type:complete